MTFDFKGLKKAGFNSMNGLWSFTLKSGERIRIQSTGVPLSADRTPPAKKLSLPNKITLNQTPNPHPRSLTKLPNPATSPRTWEAVVEVTYSATIGRADLFQDWIEDTRARPSPISPSPVLVRTGYAFTLAAGRRARSGRPGPDEEPVEEHLIEVWQAPPGPEAIHRLSDEVGIEARSDP